ncbi:two-component regulator propeller domain-containing protein [Flammeovirgaceae bacterium SG7u.111]|nr:two-component regulator propeller domain-containing protein [Flammeovirgaceae bacterium SG7u.132]WPO38246.1 two-component regulator propeller domain-containing protein [Flammeovirgaceae bacterium SG7u.111]
MKLASKSILAILISCLISVPLFAQYSNFRSYDQADGLSQSYVYSVAQTPDGYLWSATGDGLSRFDGSVFKTYTVNDGLAEDFVTSLYVDASGTLIAGHYQGAVSIYDASLKRFKVVAIDSTANSRVNQLYVDEDKAIWVLFQNEGLLKIQDGSTAFYSLPQQLSYFSFQLLENRKVLLGTNEGLWLGDLKKDDLGATSFPEFAYQKINAISGDGESYLIGTDGKGLFRYKDGEILDLSKTYLLENERIQAVLSTKKEIWVALKSSGLVLLSSEGSQKYFKEENGLPSNYPLCLFQDMEGNVWTGLNGAGLSMYMGGAFELDPLGSLQNDVTAILLAKKDGKWIGTSKGLRNERKSVAVPSSLPSSTVTGIAEDKEGRLWVGFAEEGLFRWDIEKNKVERLTGKNGFDSKNINQVIADKNGDVWVGTQFLGVFHFIENSIVQYSTENGLLHNNAKDLYCDKENKVWVITPSTGVCYIGQGKVGYFDTDPVLKTIGFNCLVEDKDGDLWFGTNGSGVLYYDGAEFVNYTSAEGLLSNYIYMIVADEQKVWAGSRNGLSSISKSDNLINEHSYQNELKDIELSSKAVFCPIENVIYFGTDKGLLVYNPAKSPEVVEPIIQLTRLLVFDDTLSNPSAIQLPYDSYRLRFSFKGISLKKPESVRYQYKLEGYDIDWSDVTTETLAQYPRVEDGEYEFKVRALNGDGVWSSQEATIRLAIEKPIWKQWWFFVLVAVALSSAGYSYNYIKLKRLTKRNKELEVKVAERTEQLEARKTELEEANVQLDSQKQEIETAYKKLVDLESFKDSMTNMIVHDLKNPLNSVISMSDGTPIIRQAGQQMLNMVMNILDVHKLEEASLKLNLEHYPMKLAVDEAIFQTELLVREKGLTFREELKGDLIANMDYDLIVRVVVNLMTNAIKYTPVGGEISVDCHQEMMDGNSFVKVSVNDTGPGIPADYKDQVFEKYKQIDQKSSGLTASTGLGLTFCKLAIEAHGGKIGLESEEGKGSEFYFLLESTKDSLESEGKVEEFTIGKVEISLTPEDKQEIEPYLAELNSLDIFDTSENIDIIKKIDANSKTLATWKSEFEMAIYSFNENRYRELLEMVG